MYKILGGDGKEYGPVSTDTLRQWINEGRANAQTQVLPEGATAWVALGSLPEFSLLFLASTHGAGSPSVSPGVSQVSGGTNSMALTGMIMGICSITVGLLCCGPLMAILGIIFSVIGMNQLKSNPAQTGRGMAIAGLITSIIGLAVGIAFAVLFGILGAIGETMK